MYVIEISKFMYVLYVLKQEFNVNCRVQAFGKVVKKLDDRKREIVRKMGFGVYYF